VNKNLLLLIGIGIVLGICCTAGIVYVQRVQQRRAADQFATAFKADDGARAAQALSRCRILLAYTSKQDGRTLLHLAAHDGKIQAAGALLKAGAAVNARDARGKTPLFLAVSISTTTPAMVQLLLDHGADVNAVAQDGSAPLGNAVLIGTTDIVTLLLEHGADVNYQAQHADNALASAIRLASPTLVRLMVEHGADVNQKNLYGKTPLKAAAEMETFLAAVVKRHGTAHCPESTVARMLANEKVISAYLRTQGAKK
jgi:ankyrin repeat protein